MSFEALNLDEKLLRAVKQAGFTTPTDIQREAIPVVLQNRDIMASAQTGTGKTAAFVLPALQKLLSPDSKKSRSPRVLILTPTRELATQVSENIRQYGRFANFISGDIVGGMPYPPQIRMLKTGVDIIVATPGRLMDHMDAGYVDLSNIEILVLDEADRMLDMGFVDDVKLIAAKTPATRQTLLFSATLQGAVLSLTKGLLRDPVRIEISARTVKHDSITQRVHQADDFSHKHKLLAHCLENDGVTQAVIFTATKRSAEQLAETLKAQGQPAAALHGDMRQNARKRTVEQMRRGKFKYLVATDVAARGLDIKGLSHVFNFDLPMVAEDYVHRIGRTGRGGATGTAISFVGPDDNSKLSAIERFTGQKFQREVIPGLEPKKSFASRPRFADNKRPGSGRPSSGPRRSYGGNSSHAGNTGNGGNERSGGRPFERRESRDQRGERGEPREQNRGVRFGGPSKPRSDGPRTSRPGKFDATRAD